MSTPTRRIAVAALLAASTIALAGCLGDGIHPVGDGGVATGVYHSAGARPGRLCSYQRLGSDQARFGDGFSAVGDGPQFLELAFTDKALVTEGCELWVATGGLEPLLGPGQPIPPGTYRVGTDVAPGVYSTRGSAICTWSRLRNARHDGTSVIASGSVPGVFGFVTISPTDAFFETRGCGPWDTVA